MIKVLEEKEVPRAQVECDNCHSLLEYGNADLIKERDSTYHYMSTYKLLCPVCGCKVNASWIRKKEESV